MTLDELNAKIGGKYPITEKQFKFCQSYARDKNGMKAIRDAGFSHSTPGSQSSAAYRLLKLDRIKAALEILKSA